MIATKDERFMTAAIEQAMQAKELGNLPFGAVVVLDGRVVGMGFSTEVSDHAVTAHAEIKAIGEASAVMAAEELPDAVIYCSGEPCFMCLSAILMAKISRIVIAASRSDLTTYRTRQLSMADLLADASYQPVVDAGLLKEQSLALFHIQ